MDPDSPEKRSESLPAEAPLPARSTLTSRSRCRAAVTHGGLIHWYDTSDQLRYIMFRNGTRFIIDPNTGWRIPTAEDWDG
jgi:hypothetical protein